MSYNKTPQITQSIAVQCNLEDHNTVSTVHLHIKTIPIEEVVSTLNLLQYVIQYVRHITE